MHARAITLFLLVAFCLILANNASATSVVELSLREIAEASNSIVHGTVVTATSRWNEDRTLIVTDVVVKVQDTLKGDPGPRVVITQPGGRVGSLRVDVDGAAVYRPGDEAILFLHPSPRGGARVVGLFQGRFDVAVDPRSGRKVVRGLSAEALGAVLLDKPGVETERAAPVQRGPVPLEEFLEGVRVLVHDIAREGGK
jgi:hypothetical protein